MQDPGYELRRISLPGTSVNKGKQRKVLVRIHPEFIGPVILL
jgi:hypothetical protein